MRRQDFFVSSHRLPKVPYPGLTLWELFKRIKPVYVAAFPLILIGLMALSSTALATDYYVKTPANGGNNANSGLDWANAKATIGAAMGAVNGDDSIYAAAGTYNEKIAFPQYNNIALRGGYPAAGGANQDPAANPTIIDGSNLSTASAMISIPMQQNGTNGYSGIVIEGFTIRNGTRTGSGTAGIESYSLGVTIKRNIIENNQVTGTGGYAGGIYIFAPLSDRGKTVIEQNIIRNNAAAAVGGIYLEGASGKTERYTVYLVNNLIYGNQSTTTDPSWNRGVGGIDIMYPAGASIVNCTIADNTAAHPTNAIGGISIDGFSTAEKGIAAISNSIVWHGSGKDILAATNGTLWIAYSAIKDTGISGTGVIHTDPQFAGTGDYHLTSGSLSKNAGSALGTVLSGSIAKSPWAYLPDIGFKNSPYNYSDAQVSLSWGDSSHNLTAQWQYNSTSGNTIYGKFFGRNNVNCNADVTSGQPLGESIPATVDASTYSYTSAYSTAKRDPFQAKEMVFWKGANGYYGAWRIDGIGLTALTSGYGGRLTGLWYFQINGGPYFDSGIRSTDIEGNTRPAETGYDMGAYEYAPDATPPTGSITINGGAACTKSADATLGLSASDPSGVAEMQFSNEAEPWSTAEAYGITKAWTLSAGKGTKTVQVKYKDAANNWSSPFSATIILPSAGDLNNDGKVDLADVLLALKVAAGLPVGNQPAMLCADVNDDSRLNLLDTIYILQIASELRSQ